MAISNEVLKKYVLGQPYDSKLLYATINEIVYLVIRRHYSKYENDTELVSLGFFKATKSLSASHVNPGSVLTSYVYTGVRNEIGNYLKREAKFSKRELTQYDNCVNSQSVLGDYLAEDSLNSRLNVLYSNFKMLGFDFKINLKGLLDGSEKEISGYKRFVLKAAFLRELSNRGR